MRAAGPPCAAWDTERYRPPASGDAVRAAITRRERRVMRFPASVPGQTNAGNRPGWPQDVVGRSLAWESVE